MIGKLKSMGYGMGQSLPPKFSDFMIAHVANQVAQKTEQTIFTGVAANAGEYDGFETLLTADGNIPAGQDLAAVGGGINAANVIARTFKSCKCYTKCNIWKRRFILICSKFSSKIICSSI